MAVKEIWKDVPELEEYLEVSTLGRVKSKRRKITRSDGLNRDIGGKILKPTKDEGGYLRLWTYTLSGKSGVRVHRLIASTFIPNLENKPQVNHKDGNKENIKVDNLEWCTNLENQIHAFENGLQTRHLGSNHHNFKGVISVFKNGKLIHEIKGKRELESLGFSYTAVSGCLNGRQKTHKGLIFKRK